MAPHFSRASSALILLGPNPVREAEGNDSLLQVQTDLIGHLGPPPLPDSERLDAPAIDLLAANEPIGQLPRFGGTSPSIGASRLNQLEIDGSIVKSNVMTRSDCDFLPGHVALEFRDYRGLMLAR